MRPLPFAGIVVLLALWGLFIIHQRAQAVRHGYRIQKLEAEKRSLLDSNDKLAGDVAALVRPDRIVKEVKDMKVDLSDPVDLGRQSVAGPSTSKTKSSTVAHSAAE